MEAKYKELTEKLDTLEGQYADGMAVIALADKMKNAWFWRGSTVGNASSRKRYDRNHTASARWEEGDHSWYAEFETRSTSSHVYTSSYYTRDGERTNLKAARYSLKRLESEIEACKAELAMAEAEWEIAE